MIEDNSNYSSGQNPGESGGEGNEKPADKPKKKKRRRIWIIIPVILLLLLILILLLAPTILSSGPVREMVLDRVNKQFINGHLDIQDWSFDWTSGISVKGIELKDSSDAHVASVGAITCELKLLHALTGNLDLGDVQIIGLDFNARRDQNGRLNIDSLFKSTGPSNPQPSKLPNIKGVIHLVKATGTFEDDLPEQHQLVALEEIDATIDIKDINQPIADSISVNGVLNHQTGANVKIDGTVSAIQNNLVDLTNLGGGQTVHVAVADTTPGTSQAINLVTDSSIQLGGPTLFTIPSFEISQGTIDLHHLQEQGLIDMVLGKWGAAHKLKINAGKITLAGKGSMDASGFGLQQPLVVHIDPIDLSMTDAVSGVQTMHLPPIDLQVSGTSGNVTAHLTMDAASNPILAADATAQPANGGMQFNVTRCDGDITRLQAAFGPILPLFSSSPAVQMIAQNVSVATTGKFSMTISGSLAAAQSSVKLNASVTNLTVQQGGAATPINAMNLTLATAGSMTQGKDGFQVDVPTLSLAEGNDFQLQADSSTPIHFVSSMVSGISGSGAIKLQADLPKLTAMAAVFATPQQVTSLKQLTSGQLNGSIQLQHASDGSNTAAADLTVAQLNYGSQLNNETVHLTAGGAVTPDGQSLGKLTLNLDTSFAKLTVANPTPIVLADLTDRNKLSVQTSIVADGDIERLCRLAEAFSGKPVNSYPYKGHYHFEQAINKDASQSDLKLAGGGTVSQFQVFGSDGSVVLAEDQIPIKNDCDYNVSTNSITIDKSDPLSITLKQSGALSLSVTGGASDLAGQRKIDGISADVDYDLAKLWPIIKPLLPPAQQQKLSDLVITGKQKRTFLVSGSFPPGKPFNEAIVSLNASGVMTVDSLSTQGVTIQNLDLPIVLSGGVLQTVYSDKAAGQNAPKPGTCNGGSLDIGIISLDLRSDPMLLSMPGVDAQHPHAILKNIALNPTMAKSMLGSAMANPFFGGDATASQGFVDLSILKCQNLPLSQLLTQQSSQNTGQAELQYSIRQLQLGGGLLGLLGVNNNTPANINNADVQLAGGKVTEDTMLALNKTQTVHLFGTVGLQTMEFMPMNIGIPPSLLPQQWLADRSILNYMPNEIQVPVEGSVSSPKLRLDKVLPKLISDATQKALLGNLTGQQPTNPSASQPTQDQNPLNNLLQNLTKPKNKKN